MTNLFNLSVSFIEWRIKRGFAILKLVQGRRNCSGRYWPWRIHAARDAPHSRPVFEVVNPKPASIPMKEKNQKAIFWSADLWNQAYLFPKNAITSPKHGLALDNGSLYRCWICYWITIPDSSLRGHSVVWHLCVARFGSDIRINQISR